MSDGGRGVFMHGGVATACVCMCVCTLQFFSYDMLLEAALLAASLPERPHLA